MDAVFECRISRQFVKAKKKKQQRKKNEMQAEARLKDKYLYLHNGKFKEVLPQEMLILVDACGLLPPSPP